MTRLYYTAPTEEQFEELREAAIELWKEIDVDHDKYGYASGKIARIQHIGNIQDNFMYIVAMFDRSNQSKLAGRLSYPTREAIRERMLEGGSMPYTIPF